MPSRIVHVNQKYLLGSVLLAIRGSIYVRATYIYGSTFHPAEQRDIASDDATAAHPMGDDEECVLEHKYIRLSGWLPDRANCGGPIGTSCAVTPRGNSTAGAFAI